MGGARVLVVGASSGVGRALAQRFVAAGADVAFAARRVEHLEAAIAEAGGGIAIPGDVRAPGGAADLVARATEALGGFDVVVYSTGVSPLHRLRDATREEWLQVLETNLVGMHEVVQAALPHLAPGAVVGVLSSDSVGNPRPGLVPYASSKAALEELLHGWRTEHPEVRFACITIGPTFPTEFGVHFDPDLMVELFHDWSRLGMVHASLMDGNELADVIVTTVSTLLAHPGIGMEHIVLRPASGIVADVGHMEMVAETNAMLAEQRGPAAGGDA